VTALFVVLGVVGAIEFVMIWQMWFDVRSLTRAVDWLVERENERSPRP